MNNEMNFDRSKYVNNYMAVAKKQGKKSSELEKKYKISDGYIKRLTNESNKTKMSADLAFCLAEHVGVTMDFLANANYLEMGPQDRQVSEFIESLRVKTSSGDIDWNGISFDELTDIRLEGKRPFLWVDSLYHNSCGDYPDIEEIPFYNSIFHPKRATSLVVAKRAVLKSIGAEVFIISYMIVSIKEDGSIDLPLPFDDEQMYEIYMIKDVELMPICSVSYDDRKEIAVQINSLLTEIEDNKNTKRIGKDALGLMEAFINS